MLAIHNDYIKKYVSYIVANAYAKLSKCQQFTTDFIKRFVNKGLQTLLQSYQNVSNSQPIYLNSLLCYCCKRFCKVIKMLAIHNVKIFKFIIIQVANAYAKLSKCQQFTTKYLEDCSDIELQTLMQSYQNVSNSQLRTL